MFLWSNRTDNSLVVRTGDTPDALGESRTLLEPGAVDGQPKFSATHANGSLHLLVTAHQDDRLHYFRGDSESVERVGTAVNVATIPGYDMLHRTAVVRHEGTWYVYVAMRALTDTGGVEAKETVLFSGPTLTDLDRQGVVIGEPEHPKLSMSANVGSVWVTEAGEFRAFVDGSGAATGEHEYVFTATSPDGVNWTVADEPELDRADIDAGYNKRHIYAPAGTWVDGTFTGLAVGADGRGIDGDYDHDTTLFQTDGFAVRLDDYADTDQIATPTPTPTTTPTPTPAPTATPTPTPTRTPTAMPTAAPSGGGSGGGAVGPVDPLTPTPTPGVETPTPAPTLGPARTDATPPADRSERAILRWLLDLLREVQP